MPKSRSEYAEQGSFFSCVKNMESYPWEHINDNNDN